MSINWALHAFSGKQLHLAWLHFKRKLLPKSSRVGDTIESRQAQLSYTQQIASQQNVLESVSILHSCLKNSYSLWKTNIRGYMWLHDVTVFFSFFFFFFLDVSVKIIPLWKLKPPYLEECYKKVGLFYLVLDESEFLITVLFPHGTHIGHHSL